MLRFSWFRLICLKRNFDVLDASAFLLAPFAKIVKK